MLAKTLYTTTSRATGGGRDGVSGTVDGPFEVKLGLPKEMGGKGEGVNPEQLFATGYAACFLSAFRLVAGQAGTRLSPETSVSATVGIGPRTEGPGFGLSVALTVTVPEGDPEVIRKLVETAHTVCPYSNATRGNVDVKLHVA
jgi:lipoyl-dependent peroxiredoxin